MICLKSDLSSIEKVVNCLKKNGIAILPTDTVYGFSAIVSNETEKKIRFIKGRSEKKPFINLIANPEDILKYTNDKIPDKIFNLWPGALTVIVNDKNGGTTAFRCPKDEWIRKVILLLGQSIFSTSVNRSGNPQLETIDEIISEFCDEVDLIINDGDKILAKPSTIVQLENSEIKIIRQGDLIIS